MNNTDKLLRAFIEASGYEIETLLDYKEKKMQKAEAMRHNTGWGAKLTEYSLSSTHGCMLDIDEDGLYTARLREPVVDYKVTKKKAQAIFDVDSPEWKGLVSFVLQESVNIELDIERYRDLKPMLDYFNGKS